MKIITTLFLLLNLTLLPLQSKEIQENKKDINGLFTSNEDGAFDVSDYLGTRYGFLPVPSIITEPAIGYGAAFTLLFLHDSFYSTKKRKSPPSISGISAFATENGTKGGAAFHIGFWKEDTIRTTTFVGAVDINMNFYLSSNSFAMNIPGAFGYQEIMFRLGESNFFAGANYVYSDVSAESRSSYTQNIKQDFKMGALATIFQYDSRDSIFTPTKGLFAKANIRRFDDKFGGDENFWRYGAKAFYFTSFARDFTLGIRVEGETVNTSAGDRVPFFANPSINMRGVPAMRYQGEKMLMSELQLRYEFIPRWNIVAFGGAGKVYGNEITLFPELQINPKYTSLKDAPLHPAGGLGFRYELARKFGLWAGVDLATSQDRETAIYITVGSAWGAF